MSVTTLKKKKKKKIVVLVFSHFVGVITYLGLRIVGRRY